MQSDDLPFVLPLLGAVSVGDERGVSARLEAAHRAGMDEMKRMVAVIARGATQPAVQQPVVTPDIMVTSPTFATITRGSSEAGPHPALSSRGQLFTAQKRCRSQIRPVRVQNVAARRCRW